MTPLQGPRRLARRAVAPLLLALLVAALATGCGGSASPTTSGEPSSGPTDAPGTVEPTSEPTDEPTDEPSGEPTASAEPTPTLAPEPTEEPTATPTPTAPGAEACTGNDNNRAFYAGVAADVDWDVYCPVLPAGWFVTAGEFKLAAGGRLEIGYRGPGSQRLAIRQGFYCAGSTGCIPADPGAGPASFGDRAGLLVDLGDGSWLVVATEADGLAWEATGSGMDGEALAALTAAFARVGE